LPRSVVLRAATASLSIATVPMWIRRSASRTAGRSHAVKEDVFTVGEQP
jgi:hypothetical protein